MSQPSNLQLAMIKEANLIFASIDWLESNIDAKLELFEKCLSENKIKEASLIEKEVMLLIRKLSSEEKNMDSYMEKYRKLIENEKKKMLHDSK